jgi:hypothetical protein
MRRAIPRLLPIVWASFILSCLCADIAFGADAPSSATQKAVIQEVVRVANNYIDHGPCEPSHAEPSVVATMSPYTPDVAAGRGVAEYVVFWSGDMDCSDGSDTNTMNYFLVEKRGAVAASIVGVGSIDSAANIQRIVATTSDSVTVDVYTWAPDDGHCCPTAYERWRLHRERDGGPGSYTLKVIEQKPVRPVPPRPGEKRLPTAQ